VGQARDRVRKRIGLPRIEEVGLSVDEDAVVELRDELEHSCGVPLRPDGRRLVEHVAEAQGGARPRISDSLQRG
jgi:hypothetical protein